MEPKRDLAIILKTIRYQDRHQIVQALTQSSGKIEAIAYNSVSSRRFGGGLELFAASEWLYHEKSSSDFKHLDGLNLRHTFSGIQRDFKLLSTASALNEILLSLIVPEESSEELFRLHSNALLTLERPMQNFHEIFFLNSYFGKLLQWSGQQPQMEKCLKCARPLECLSVDDSVVTGFVPEAGWACQICQTHNVGSGRIQNIFKLTKSVTEDYFQQLKNPIRKATEICVSSLEEHCELFLFLESLLVFHLGGIQARTIRSLRFLNIKRSILAPSRTSYR